MVLKLLADNLHITSFFPRAEGAAVQRAVQRVPSGLVEGVSTGAGLGAENGRLPQKCNPNYCLHTQSSWLE